MRKGADRRTYKSWQSMLSRCLNREHRSYPNYGGRGVAVCDRWLSFDDFLADMGVRPNGMTLDRYPNASGNYEPTNCRWATVEEQNRNKRDNVVIVRGDERMTAAEWASKLGISQNLITARIRRGWDAVRALSPPTSPPSQCPAGHSYAGDNLFVRKDGRRECRACMRARDRANKERRRVNAQAN